MGVSECILGGADLLDSLVLGQNLARALSIRRIIAMLLRHAVYVDDRRHGLTMGLRLCWGGPGLGSGPLATVIQDLLSILMYFVIVTSVVR
jgi:hypothetical protein